MADPVALVFQPNRAAHGAYWFYWTTHDEIAWKKQLRSAGCRFLDDYKNHGGRVTTWQKTAGFIYKHLRLRLSSASSSCCRRRDSTPWRWSAQPLCITPS